QDDGEGGAPKGVRAHAVRPLPETENAIGQADDFHPRSPQSSGSWPVSCRKASMYFARVFSTTSPGSSGAGGVLFHPVDSRQSRTNCLSNDGGLLPGAYWSAGQKREESGVRASSIQTMSPPARPNSNFVSAMMMPRVSAYSAACL